MDFFIQYKDILIEVLKAAVIAIAAILIYKLLIRDKSSKKVRRQAYTDELTGKGNRYLFYSDLDKLIDQDKN